MLEQTIRIFFAGDFCSKPSTTKISVSEELKSKIQSCDLKVVNFEVPLKPEGVQLPPQGRERFYQHDDSPDFLRSLGFNLFTMANNHAFDWGEEGFLKTKKALGDAAFGAGNYEEAYKVKIVEMNGVKIGFMALSFAAYKGVFDDVMNHEGLGCAYVNDLRVNHDIVEAKQRVDFLFILPHDGVEYVDIPLPETIARYRDFVDWGADGVIASHSHCPQGWEVYKGKPIFYSLGNFLFNSKEGYAYRVTNRPHWYEGLCVIITIENNKISWVVVNSRNLDNMRLEIDNIDEREKHNSYICNLLDNQAEYKELLKRECERLAEVQELPIINSALFNNSFGLTLRSLVKLMVKRIAQKSFPRERELLYLLKNETRRLIVERSLRFHRS